MGDVAAAAGVKLSEAESALQALAYDAQAVLQVCMCVWGGGQGGGGAAGERKLEGCEGGGAGFHTGQISAASHSPMI